MSLLDYIAGKRRPSLIDRRTPHFLCWYCAKQLPANFTSVEKNGETLRVHYECRPMAAELAAMSTPVQDNPDYPRKATA